MKMLNKIQIVLIIFLLLCYSPGKAQSFPKPGSSSYKQMNRHGALSLSGGLGMSSYFGDLKGRQTDIWAKPSTQLGVQYRVNNHFHIRTETIWYRIAGADSLNDKESSIYSRNLSFRSDNIELNIQVLYQLFNNYSRFNRHLLNPYGFAGVGITSVKPEALYKDEWHNLRPLMTEGVNYNSVAIVVPFGLGVSYHVNRNWDWSFEFGYRYSFSDYLDDVSSVHIGVENVEDPIAKALSDRRPEKGLLPVKAGNIRGNANINDWYFIAGLKATYTPGINYRKPSFR